MVSRRDECRPSFQRTGCQGSKWDLPIGYPQPDLVTQGMPLNAAAWRQSLFPCDRAIVTLPPRILVGVLRFELRVSWSQTRRDNQASLHPELVGGTSWNRTRHAIGGGFTVPGITLMLPSQTLVALSLQRYTVMDSNHNGIRTN